MLSKFLFENDLIIKTIINQIDSTDRMGGSESKTPITKYGLFKHYLGEDIVL